MPTEADVRLHKIDEELTQVGWSEKQGTLSKEWWLKGTARDKRVHETPAGYESGDERVDYQLKERDGKPIAIVEAKRDAHLSIGDY